MDLPNPAAITLAPTSSPFTLKPIIQDLVRTRFAILGSIFLVEDVQITPLTKTGRWQSIRLLLGDGELCIQAILEDTMHRFVHTREITVGSYVRAQDFQVRLKNVDSTNQSKQMVFLVVYDVKTIGWNDDVCKLYAAQHDNDAHVPHEYVDKGKSPVPASVSITSAPTKRRSAPSSDYEEVDMEDAFEQIEALTFPAKKAQETPSRRSRNSSNKPHLPVALQKPLELTNLYAILHPPYHQDWSYNILAVIASLSPVESSNLPPYKQQRTARIADPSTAEQVHLTVFLDPDEFSPKVGSAVLLTGVENHSFEGVSLRKADDKDEGMWWFEDPWDLAWCKVREIKEWWADMEAFFASQLEEQALGSPHAAHISGA